MTASNAGDAPDETTHETPDQAPDQTPAGLVVVGNPEAGSHDQEAVDAACDVWRAAGLDVEVVATSSPDELAEVIADLDGRLLVAAGGDGSVHAVVQGLADAEALTDVVVGLLPMGTGNDLARGIGLPLEPEAAARALLDGTAHPMDLLVDQDGMVAVNAVNLGIGAVASQRAASLKPTMGAAAYPAGALGAGITEAGWTLTVTVDDTDVVTDTEVLHIVIGNGPSVGGGTAAAPDADPEDAAVDVVVSLATGGLARIAYATALQRGQHTDRDDVVTTRGSTVVITGDELPYNVDGELPDPRTRSTWRLHPHAWRLRHPGATPDL